MQKLELEIMLRPDIKYGVYSTNFREACKSLSTFVRTSCVPNLMPIGQKVYNKANKLYFQSLNKVRL
jgi:hypothetical protein